MTLNPKALWSLFTGEIAKYGALRQTDTGQIILERVLANGLSQKIHFMFDAEEYWGIVLDDARRTGIADRLTSDQLPEWLSDDIVETLGPLPKPDHYIYLSDEATLIKDSPPR